METIDLTHTAIWEETDLIEQLTKFENKPTFVLNDGINVTNNEFANNECGDIGNRKKWTKTCPSCNRVQVFQNEKQLKRSISRNRGCLSCIQKKNHVGEKLGKITIINQYYVPIKHQSELRVDYVCECGNKTLNKAYQKVKTQKMCKKCRNTNFYKVNLETSFNALFNDYVQSATRRKLVFTLSKDEFKTLTKENCFYCGCYPASIRRPKATSGEYVYNGIDRKNNSIGYVLDNCVSCCKTCNFAKHQLGYNEFLNHVKRIYDFHFRGKV